MRNLYETNIDSPPLRWRTLSFSLSSNFRYVGCHMVNVFKGFNIVFHIHVHYVCIVLCIVRVPLHLQTGHVQWTFGIIYIIHPTTILHETNFKKKSSRSSLLLIRGRCLIKNQKKLVFHPFKMWMVSFYVMKNYAHTRLIIFFPSVNMNIS